MNKKWLNSFHEEYDTVTNVQLLCKFTYIKKMYVAYFFQKILWVDKNCNMLNIRTEYPIATNFSVQSGNITNFDESEKYI